MIDDRQQGCLVLTRPQGGGGKSITNTADIQLYMPYYAEEHLSLCML